MDRYWIGDFRCKALELVYTENEPNDHVHFYLYDDFADYNWFISEGLHSLQTAAPSSATIILMLGLVDCIQSCTWLSSIKITDIAKKYAESLNALIKDFPMCKFHFCAVTSVDGDYSSTFAPNGFISASDLNTKIKNFNTVMRENCNAIFVDCAQYLDEVGYTTYDGIRYDYNTCSGLHAYIISCLQEISGAAIAPRFSVNGFKTDEVTATSIKASAVVIKGRSYSYILTRNNKSIVEGVDTIDEDKTFIQLTFASQIRPNATYLLKIIVQGEYNDEIYEGSIEINTPPSRPKSASNLNFVCLDKYIDAKSRFSFSATKPTDLGYWKSDYGYEEILFVNGVAEKTLFVKSFGSPSFTIKDRYGYMCKTGDTIQIGVRVWTRDEDDNVWYDDQAAKTSQTICLLNRAVSAYMNLD